MQSFQEWRDGQAKKLKEISDHDEKRSILETLKTSPDYSTAKDLHLQEILTNISILSSVDQETRNFFIGIFRAKNISINDKIFEKQLLHGKRFTGTLHGDMAFGTQFTIGWRKLNEEKIKLLQELLKDSILVDLGGGLMPMDMATLARKTKVRSYVDVDMRLTQPDEIDNLPVTFSGPDRILLQKDSEMEIFAVGDEMLRFLWRLKDSNVSICMNGIDENIVVDKEYAQKLIDQVVRVTKTGGIVMGNSSIIYSYFKSNPSFELIFEHDKNFPGMNFVFKKKEILEPEDEINQRADIYPDIVSILAVLGEKEVVISEDDIRSVIKSYWENLLLRHKTNNIKSIDMQLACNRFMANIGNYLLNGSLKDLAIKRSKVIFSILDKGIIISEEEINTLSSTHPEYFPSDSKELVRKMFFNANHGFKGTLMTILMDPAMEKITSTI